MVYGDFTWVIPSAASVLSVKMDWPAFTQTCFTMPSGVAFTAGLSMWCTTSAEVGVTQNPINPVIVKLITT